MWKINHKSNAFAFVGKKTHDDNAKVNEKKRETSDADNKKEEAKDMNHFEEITLARVEGCNNDAKVN